MVCRISQGNITPRPPLLKSLPQTLTALLALPLLQLCRVAITPDCIMTMYNITAAKSAVSGNQ